MASAKEEEIEEAEKKRFRRFDVVSDDSDHSYLNWNRDKNKNKKTSKGPDCFSNASSGVYKKIMKEWRLLENNLPESIYVRVYERRIDLLRAAIIGPAGTPYHDGLFFFDIAFPSDYPTRPPHVHYCSFGLRLNPNLYANGTVCLSLLNTWFGKANEKWNPNESTVLQVLVSIQGLVLNREPYFNEPGVGRYPGRVKKSKAYNENAFILSCITMVYLIRKPLKNFEELITWHFRERACNVLLACNAYMDGEVRVGRYGENGSGSDRSEIVVSNEFRRMMKPWYPELVGTLKRTGASVGNFVKQLKEDRKTASSEPKTTTTKNKKKQKKKKTGVSWKPFLIKKTKSGVRKVIRKVKKILGLKKDDKKNAAEPNTIGSN